jgi:flavin-dependent dehydrogenase
MDEDLEGTWDVAVVGGGLAASSLALLIRRADPALRIVLLEKDPEFRRKVGESAIELSSWFLLEVLGLGRHLALDHLPKYGLRFWFHNDRVGTLAQASELGNLYQARVPSFHIDRAVLDEHLLGLATAEGARLLRPARVTGVDLEEGGASTLRVEGERGPFSLRARWVVDGAGRRAWLARSLGLHHPIQGHPTCSVWARFRGVRDFDGGWLEGRNKERAGAVCQRGLSTNHFTGAGWWVWVIPLPCGETSVGLVWDERIFRLPGGGSLGERFEAFLRSFPAGRELLQGATRLEGDLHTLRDLPFKVDQIAGDGWAMVGDAAGFLDPFYSSGLDWACLTAVKTSELILRSLEGRSGPAIIQRHNREFRRGLSRWFEAIYRDKYFYLGDAELMEIALRLEVALYYFGVVTPPYRGGTGDLAVPFSLPVSAPFYRLMAFVNRRLARLGRLRLASGGWGRLNDRRRVLLSGFRLGPSSLGWVPGALARLALAEVRSVRDRLGHPGRRRKAQAPPDGLPGDPATPGGAPAQVVEAARRTRT